MTIVIPSSMLTYINNDLGPNPNSPWITISWQLGAAVFLSIGGRLSDIFGRRYFIMTGSIICTVGCLVGATAQSIGAMIVSGALFGIGAGFLELAYALVQEMIPNRYRLMAIGEQPFLIEITMPSEWALTSNTRRSGYLHGHSLYRAYSRFCYYCVL
jgi:MFS family permease